MLRGIFKFNTYAKQKAIDAESRMIPFALFGIIAYVLFYYINKAFISSVIYDNFTLRIIIFILCFFLLIKAYWPAKLKPYLHIYWYFTLFFSLPFFITFMTLMNHGASAWVLNELAIVILMMLLVDWIMYTILFIFGLFFAIIAYKTLSLTPFQYIPGKLHITDIINTFSISLIMGLIFSKRKDETEQEKIKVMHVVSAIIAHELRIPLSAIKTYSKGIVDYLPSLFESYKLAKKHQLQVPLIRQDELVLLEDALTDIENETKYANIFINMLLQNVKQIDIKSEQGKNLHIKTVIQETLKRYPFESHEVGLVEYDNKNPDFIIYSNEILIIHVFFNLIKNALYYIHKAGKGVITISAEIGDKYNYVYFEDTGTGIAKQDLSKIFDRFYTKTQHGSGIGLSFCKAVMKTYGGSIRCESELNQYTRFILSFPKIKAE